MNKAELIEEIHGKFDGEITKKVVADLVDSVFEAIVGAVKKEQRFSYPLFGTFKLTKRKARKGRNPQTGEPIKIKASKGVGFKAAPSFKEKL